MLVIKRDGREVEFDVDRIVNAITKANMELQPRARISDKLIDVIADDIMEDCEAMPEIPTVEMIQDMVEIYLMRYGAGMVARNYIKYRFRRELARKANTTDEAMLTLIDRTNEEAKAENANKNPTINSTLRDYLAGEVSRDLTERILLPGDVVKAHKEAIIHFHDSDYYAQHMYNCCLINMEDMLTYGTVISGKKIEPPKSFHTGCNIATQIVAQVGSNQYGGQTFNLAHLIPLVDVSRQKLRRKVREELKSINPSEELINEVEKVLKETDSFK